MYIPNSPVYNPSSPAYNAASNLNPSYTRGGGSPIDDNEDDIKTTNPQKKNEWENWTKIIVTLISKTIWLIFLIS